jgi:serine-type D-Ala-D-Ala endopeptidase (penicillin-binding protein 7)
MSRALCRLWVVTVVAALLASAPAEARRKSRRRPRYVPVPALTKDGLPNVQAAAAVVVDLETGEELFAKNAGDRRAIASISKLAAALAVRRAGVDLAGETAVTTADVMSTIRGGYGHLAAGWILSNKDLIFAALIASENRAVPAMGRGAGLSTEGLVAAMNAVALDLGLTETGFDEPTGLSYNNKSTAREVVELLKAAMADEVLSEAMRSGSATLSAASPAGVAVSIRNTNRFTREAGYTVLGGKTGYNRQAGYCLATAIEVEGRKVAVVVLGAHSCAERWADIRRIKGWLSASRGVVAAAGLPQ